MNKAELIEALSVHYDGSKTEAAKALNAVVSDHHLQDRRR